LPRRTHGTQIVPGRAFSGSQQLYCRGGSQRPRIVIMRGRASP
jgi:hypothetical protein